MKLCSICEQKTDIYTTVHKNHPYVNGKMYNIICFTCYFVPKIQEQKYDKNGLIVEEIDLPYCCDNLNTPAELCQQGSADSPKKAKISVDAVKKACLGTKSPKKPIFRPNPSWNLS